MACSDPHPPAVFQPWTAIKVADFGLTRARKAGASMTTCGTPLFVAPEMIAGRDDYDEKVDVYAFGVLLACLFERKSNPYVGGRVGREAGC